jgi:hypothetical protein
MEIVKKMWGNHKGENYCVIVADLVHSYKAVGCSVSLKVHFLECHLRRLRKSWAVSNEG